MAWRGDTAAKDEGGAASSIALARSVQSVLSEAFSFLRPSPRSMRRACARLLYAEAYSGCSDTRLVSEAIAFWMSEGEGEGSSRGRSMKISRSWRECRSACGICGSGGREGSMGVVVGRASGLSMEERTRLSWAERVCVRTVVACGKEAIFTGSTWKLSRW